ncbi:MAG TPA: acyltransferase [Polyangia bacterium]|nr:acyltransferase [Polyangia bacterium]
MSPAAPKVHPSALIEAGVVLGEGTQVWDGVHIRRDARIGRSCIIGEKSYIAYQVVIGDFVKINASVYICAGVVIEDFCMLSAHTVFTNDRFPRAGNRELSGLESSDPTADTLLTRVCRGTTIGANATIGPGLVLGAFSMVGMGSVVTRDLAPHALVVGNPARRVGWVCTCGQPLDRSGEAPPVECALACERCGRSFVLGPAGLRES